MPGSSRRERQELIRTLIREKVIRNQYELLSALGAAGVEMTQSTLSRELKALGVGKAPDNLGGYRYVAPSRTDDPLSPLLALVASIERAGNLLVVKTPPGNAQGVARAIDEAKLQEVMGTIAGDDTILIICPRDRDGQAVEDRLRALTGR